MSNTTPSWDRPQADPHKSQIPNGVQDCFLAEAARRRQAEATLRDCFARWGYHEIITPMYEYYDNLSVGASEAFRQAMVRFFDRDGQTLALRADFTPQIGRMAATKLYDQPMPLRCHTMGSIFRYEDPQAGRKREFTQAGIELIGVDTAAADAEVVALSIAALEALKLEGFQINLGQMAFFRALTAGLPGEALEPVRAAIDQRNSARLETALRQGGVAGSLGQLLQKLPDLVGESEVLDGALALGARLDDGPEVVSALERLGRVYDLLRAYGVAERVIIDLGEVRGMDYYTGITFRGVAPRLGWPVVSGGRYDQLIAQFGRSLPAVGFGLGIERALLAQNPPALPSIAAHLLAGACDQARGLSMVQRLRALGLCVEVDLLAMDDAGLAAEAERRGIARTLRPDGEGWRLTDASGPRIIGDEELLAQAHTWRSANRQEIDR